MSKKSNAALEAALAEPVWPAAPPAFTWLGFGVFALLAVYPFIFTGTFSHHLMIMVFLHAIMAQSWNVVAGMSGQISLGHAVFFGLGAYASALLYIKWGITPWIGLLAGMAISALAAAAIGIPTLRLRGHYFAIATLLFGISVQIVFQRWDWVGAASGIFMPIVRDDPWLVLQFHGSKLPYYYLSFGLCVIAFAVVWDLQRRRLGMRLLAVRDEPEAAASLGIDVAWHKVIAFMISGAMMSTAGTFFAQYVLVVDPDRVFNFEISVLALLMVVLGGIGTLWGPALGAAILVPLSEFTRTWFGGTGGTVDLIIYGILILLICIYQPRGLLSIVTERLRRRVDTK
ncbi:MAG: branched-chain amino acid ABC transporter permease [Hyphomicrobiaceae bacterium]|nr:branched-chain amino acid ABC transporter permease [Hyphomicrobiaceae bacterium]